MESLMDDAVLREKPWVSGFREKGELDVYAATKQERLAELHGPLQDAITTRRGTEDEILMVANMVLNDLREDSGLSREDFEAVAKQIESKVTAEPPKAPPEDRTRPTTSESPEEILRRFSPSQEEIEERWRSFDKLVDASVA
jgi:hypothetical protein